MQIARYISEMRAILPAILVVDGDVESPNNSLGLISDAELKDGIWYGHYPIFKSIALSVIGAARDVDEADEMSGVLSLLFNELRNLAGGHYIHGKQEEGESWVIVLPHQGVTIGRLTDTEVPSDPVEKIWYTEFILSVFFEDRIIVQEKLPEYDILVGVTDTSDLNKMYPPEIIVTDTIPANQKTKIEPKYLQPHHRVVLSDYRIATLTQDMYIVPRAFGELAIRIIDSRKDAVTNPILFEKKITIV